LAKLGKITQPIYTIFDGKMEDSVHLRGWIKPTGVV